jgi:hypothetical protein
MKLEVVGLYPTTSPTLKFPDVLVTSIVFGFLIKRVTRYSSNHASSSVSESKLDTLKVICFSRQYGIADGVADVVIVVAI